MNTITVKIQRGIVVEVIGVPEGMEVEVLDYDTDGADEKDIVTEGCGLVQTDDGLAFRSYWS